MGVWAEIGSSLLLFCLVFGMSATVDIRHILKQIRNRTALLIGVSLQFLILPFVGFLVVKALNLPAVTGITLLVVTSSPGGSYSNWWCSMFNADLALSVTMTAISTLLSTIMLPTNLILYTRWTYSSAVVKSLDWAALFISLIVVIGGITGGLIASARASHLGNTVAFHKRANAAGNVAGILLIALSAALSSTNQQAALWDQNARFYIGVALPAVIGLAIATRLATKFELEKPERVAVAVEACYQNTGIATSVAINMFSNASDLARAISVPLYYGIIEAVMLAIFCLVCLRLGWTKAPKDENLCVVLMNSYEVDEIEREEQEVAIEVVLGSDSKETPNDLIFEQTDDGTYIVDNESLKHVSKRGQPKQEDETDSTVDDDAEDDFEMVDLEGDTDGQRRRRRRRRPYQQLDAPSSPFLTESSSNYEENVDMTAQQHGRFGRAVSAIRARATGYRKAPEDVHSPKRGQGGEPLSLSTESTDVEEPSSPNCETIPSHLPATDNRDTIIPAAGKNID